MNFDRVRVLCFDLDNTLWDVWPVIARAEQTLYDWLREHHPRIPERWTVQQMRESRMELARQEPALAHDVTALRVESLRRQAREVGEPESLAMPAFEVFLHARHQVDLYDDVMPAFARLQQRFRMATLTNGNADLQRIGLMPHFELALTARDVGAAKPDTRAFEAVVAALGVQPHEIAYVGDDPHADVAGARSAGMRSVWVDRGVHAWPEEVIRADLEVRDLQQLAAVAVPG